MSVYYALRFAAQKHAQFVRTKREISNMPQDVARDLGVFREDADQIAYEAVYG